jgi:hypothetical protein
MEIKFNGESHARSGNAVPRLFFYIQLIGIGTTPNFGFTIQAEHNTDFNTSFGGKTVYTYTGKVRIPAGTYERANFKLALGAEAMGAKFDVTDFIATINQIRLLSDENDLAAFGVDGIRFVTGTSSFVKISRSATIIRYGKYGLEINSDGIYKIVDGVKTAL